MSTTDAPTRLAATEIARVADEFLAAHRHRAAWGMHARWDYETEEERQQRQRQEDEWLATLRRLDRFTTVGTTEWATHGMLQHELESAVAGRVLRADLWDVNQMTGWHLMVAHTAATVPVDTPERRDQALERFRLLPRIIRLRLDDLRRGMSQKYTAARQAVQRVIEQLDALLGGDELESAAYRAHDDRFAKEWRALMGREVRPAIDQFRDYLDTTYAAVAREVPGLVALPNGLEAYRAEVFRFTSLDLSPEEMLEGVEEEIAAIDAELAQIFGRMYPGWSLEQAKLAMREDPQHTHADRADMLDHARGVLAHIKPQLGRFFAFVPDVPLLVEPMTPVEEGIGASGYYQSPEGDAPGRYVLNTAHAQRCTRFETTCSAVHEGYPGHHFERIYGDARSVRHPATRELQTQAFREGWAYYGEWLAREMGVYRTDVDHAGYLLHFLEVWVGLLSDVLLHTGRLTRAEAIEMLVRRAGRLRHVAEARADRYIAAPGQVTCYMIGYREVRKMRRTAEAALGERFDPRAFHDLLLRDGPLTIPMQHAKVEQSLASAF